jgi:diaminopimelate decarboxylase
MPELVFELATIERNMREIAAAAHAAGITALFAMKSFPRDEVRALAAEHLDGWDVASPGELALAAERCGIVSIVDPSGLALVAAQEMARTRRVIAGCETADQVRAAPAGAEIAIRVSASITGRDPAVGALLDGTGHRASRFGVTTREELAALVRAANGRRVGLHVHHGPVTATSVERFIATGTAALELLPEAAFLDLGGAWHGISDLPAAFAELRAAFGNLELIVEPGRAYAAGAGFAHGRVLSMRDVGERIVVVVDLSRSCHLRWSQPELVVPPPRAEHRRKVVIVGPTCYEDDVIGEWICEPAHVAERVVLRNISGYAVAWNVGFGGVPAADVVFR